jgi:hypothetical protein
MFKNLTKAQHAIMEALCTMGEMIIMPACNIHPATLGVLCSRRLVNVIDGTANATCVFEWNMYHHKGRMTHVSATGMKTIKEFIDKGKRIAAIRELRTQTRYGLKDSVAWMNIHFPKI